MARAALERDSRHAVGAGPVESPVTPMEVAANRLKFDYFRNDCFLRPNLLLQRASRLAGIPGYIVHGRGDLVCPPAAAAALADAWPGVGLELVDGAGHAAEDPRIRAALVAAVRRLASDQRTAR